MNTPIHAHAPKDAPKYVYRFGAQGTEGGAGMKDVLGGKGSNLAEMCRLGLPVPAGFTISTEACALSTRDGAGVLLAAIEAE
ncbi:PEP/pyruvate-binding domain-containing protein, partial [Leptothrix ochracea]|uniref:PEP/pyruvate-binding domain-containing protein n=1 Tax=Leptothrix ochracea TaxID=735331 RepID=UPI0034E2EC46